MGEEKVTLTYQVLLYVFRLNPKTTSTLPSIPLDRIT